jgi:hypothetical protein
MYGCTDVLRVGLKAWCCLSRIKSVFESTESFVGTQYFLIGRDWTGDRFNLVASQVLAPRVNGCVSGRLFGRHLLQYSQQYGNPSLHLIRLPGRWL